MLLHYFFRADSGPVVCVGLTGNARVLDGFIASELQDRLSAMRPTIVCTVRKTAAAVLIEFEPKISTVNALRRVADAFGDCE